MIRQPFGSESVIAPLNRSSAPSRSGGSTRTNSASREMPTGGCLPHSLATDGDGLKYAECQYHLNEGNDGIDGASVDPSEAHHIPKRQLWTRSDDEALLTVMKRTGMADMYVPEQYLAVGEVDWDLVTMGVNEAVGAGSDAGKFSKKQVKDRWDQHKRPGLLKHKSLSRKNRQKIVAFLEQHVGDVQYEARGRNLTRWVDLTACLWEQGITCSTSTIKNLWNSFKTRTSRQSDAHLPWEAVDGLDPRSGSRQVHGAVAEQVQAPAPLKRSFNDEQCEFVVKHPRHADTTNANYYPYFAAQTLQKRPQFGRPSHGVSFQELQPLSPSSTKPGHDGRLSLQARARHPMVTNSASSYLMPPQAKSRYVCEQSMHPGRPDIYTQHNGWFGDHPLQWRQRNEFDARTPFLPDSFHSGQFPYMSSHQLVRPWSGTERSDAARHAQDRNHALSDLSRSIGDESRFEHSMGYHQQAPVQHRGQMVDPRWRHWMQTREGANRWSRN